MLQVCRLFKQRRNLPAGHCVCREACFKRCCNLHAEHCVAGVQARDCVAGVQAVYVVSEPTCPALCVGMQTFLSNAREPTCQALCCRVAGCLSGVRTYLPGTVLQGCRLFKRCRNLTSGHCVAGGQAV